MIYGAFVLVCASGYYTHVSTLADVQENVMEYLHVLSRPMVINHDHDIIWTEAYMDTVVSRTDQSQSLKEQLIIYCHILSICLNLNRHEVFFICGELLL